MFYVLFWGTLFFLYLLSYLFFLLSWQKIQKLIWLRPRYLQILTVLTCFLGSQLQEADLQGIWGDGEVRVGQDLHVRPRQ